MTKFQPKKSLGQHFLRDSKILKRIVDFAEIKKTDIMVEVGPGEGGLTKLLLEQAKKVIAVEKDEEMVIFLKGKFKKEIKEGKLEIVEGDILDFYSQNIFSPLADSNYFATNYKLVGNIPYYITGALFKKALEASNFPKSITFVVQKEVAQRIMAQRCLPAGGQGKESILSISIKVYGKPKYGGVIKAGSFYPKPKVDSAILSVRGISKEKFQRTDLKKNPKGQSLGKENFSFGEILEQNFFKILKIGFSHKRKLLIKNLENLSRVAFLGQLSKATLDTSNLKEIFEKCGISDKARAEDLKVEDWICLSKKFSP